MKNRYALGGALASYRRWLAAGLTVVALPAAHAQTAPGWSAALTASQPFSGNAVALASVADASGNVYVAGNFNGQMLLGTTTLVSTGGSDVFVAKWNTAASTWTWAVRAGGTSFDAATALALSGSTLYLTGYVSDNSAGGSNVQFGTQALPGKSTGTSASQDLFVAKLTDAGSTASFTWAVNGGGGRDDGGTSLAVSGTSVYVGGRFINSAANDQAVTFGALPLNGLSAASTFDPDVVVAKLTDAGSTASFTWAQAAGGSMADQANGLAVSGTSVYVGGYFNNNTTNTNAVTFGAAGTLNGQGASAGDDIFVAKLTDAGSTGAFAWVRPAGGAGSDRALALAANGSTVYLTGYFTNNSSNSSAVTFGAAGALNGVGTPASVDIFVAKLTDAGSAGAFTWAQAAGGLGDDRAQALAVSGTALTVGGYITNDAPNNNAVAFGSLAVAGATTTNSNDAVVAQLTDGGSTATWAWAQVGGGPSADNVNGLAVSGTAIYPVGTFSATAGFGTAAGSPLSSGLISGSFYLGQLTQTTGTSASWTRVTQAQQGGAFAGQATAPDASGNVYVVGNFTGRITLGATTLTAVGALDAFVAKWSRATSTWVWALPAGGLGNDQAQAVAVNGATIYVSGYFTEDALNSNLTRFGTTVVNGQGASSPSQDIFVAKLVDAGTSASWSWVQVAGGSGIDRATGLAVSGPNVYATGYFTNGASNANAVTFGTATLAGYAASSSNDIFVTKLTDAGSTGAFAWAVAAGGTAADQATAIAVNGTSLYATGYTNNNAANANTVTFGTTTLPGQGASNSNDVFVTKLTDAGTTATFAWAVGAGGLGADQANALALNGTSVYAAGTFTNNAANGNAVAFGGTTLPGFAAATGSDAFVTKLTDAGTTATYTWAAAGGGTGTDQATALAASGTSVYVAGNFTNTAANDNTVTFGSTALSGSGTTANTDVFLTKYTDAGSSGSVAWVQRAGSAAVEQAAGLAVSGARLYLTGFTLGAPAFGAITLANPYGVQVGFGAYLNDTSSPLATAAASRQPAFALYPNPARTAATVAGLSARATCQVLDVLGRPVATATADATGTATLALPASLAPGVYLVRSGAQAVRLTVE